MSTVYPINGVNATSKISEQYTPCGDPQYRSHFATTTVPDTDRMDDLLRIAGHAHSALPLDVLTALSLLSVAPFVLVLTTSFVRIVVVLSLVRSSIGAATLPPNAVLTGLALVLTCIVMTPTFEAVQRDAIRPYADGKLTQSAFLDRASRPLRAFMLRQTKARDLAVFARLAHRAPGEPAQDAPLTVVIPAF